MATETDSGTYVFETLEQVTITVIVEGDEPQSEGSSEEEDSLLPGPSFLSVILILSMVVYRRRR